MERIFSDSDEQNTEGGSLLERTRAAIAAQKEQDAAEAAAQAAAEAEENKSWLDRAEDETVNTARWAYNGLRSAAETVGEDVYGTAKNIVEAVSRLPEAYNRVLDTEQTITSAFTQENLAQAQETGDYSAQNEALAHAQENSTVVVDTAANLAGAFSRETRHIIGDQVDDAAEAGGWAPQSFRRSETFLEYFQSDEKKLQRAREIESVTGIPADSFLQDEAAYKEALGVYDYTKKMQNALGEQFSMDAVWQAYPELWDVAHMSTQDAALALHHMAEVRTTHGIVESFQTMLEYGNLQLEFDNLQYKIMNGTATEDERKRSMEIREELQKQKWQKTLPSFFDEPLAAMAGGVAQSAPMMLQSFRAAGEDAAPMMLASMWAGAGAGSVAPGVGTAAGAAAGGTVGLARFGWLFLSNLMRYASAENAVVTAGKMGARVGMFEGMRRPMTGEYYSEYRGLTREDGSLLLDEKAARDYATVAGLANTGIEVANLGFAKRALLGRPHATKMVGDIIASAAGRASAVESMKMFARDRGMDVLKVAGSEAAEEGLQSVSDDVVHNQIAADTGVSSIGVYSMKDMAVRGLQASTEALPAAIGFGLLSGAGGSVTGGIGRAASIRHAAAFEARYGKNAQQTMLGTAMYEKIQNALHDSKLKQAAPEVQTKVLRSQLAGTGFETAYIDTGTAMEKESGRKDLEAVAKVAGISDEELEQAIEQKGTLTVAGEQFAQAESSPELLDSVSFTPEAESMARMKKGAEATLKEITERSERYYKQQQELMEGVLETYYPADGTQETAQKREALAAVMLANPENPAEGLRSVRAEYRAQLDELIAPALNALKEGMGKGGQAMEVKDADGFTHYIRYSENSPWYKNFYALHKRAPTAQELEDMAIALTTGDANAPKVEGWVVTDAETQAAMAQSKPIIEGLQKQLAVLDSVKSTARSLNGVEMELTKGMSGEAFQVYKDLTRGLEQAPAKAAQAARMGAAIFARHADIWAKKVTEKTGAKATAMDYYRKHFGLDLEGKYVQGGAYAQPVTNTRLNLDQQVDVLDFDAMESPLEGKTPKEIIQYINENLSDTVETTADFRADVGMPKSSLGKEHIVHVRTKNQQDSISARNFTLSNFRDVIRHAYVIEETANTKKGPITEDMSKNAKKTQRRKNRVQSYFRLMVPVKAGGKLRTLVLTAENFGEKVTLDKTKTELYEAEYDKQERPLPALPRSDAYRIHAGSTTVPLTTSLRDMLRGVKDYAGNPYVEEDGTAHYGLYLENGVMYLDEAQAEQFHQMAGSRAAVELGLQSSMWNAMDMERDGATAQDIWNKTGWMRGKDGKWRFEIPDNLDKIDFGNAKGAKNLPEIYDNKKLFEAYPALKLVLVKFVDDADAFNGATVEDGGYHTIFINAKAMKERGTEATKKTLVHEIQHVIQSYEGFAMGGTPEQAKQMVGEMQTSAAKTYFEKHGALSYFDLAGEQEANETAKRAGDWTERARWESEKAAHQKAFDELKNADGVSEEMRAKLDEYVRLFEKEGKSVEETARFHELEAEFDALDEDSPAWKAYEAADEIYGDNLTEQKAPRMPDHRGTSIISFDGREVARVVLPEAYAQAAMYENHAQDFRTFRENVLSDKAGKSYQYVGTGENVLKVTSDDVKHIQRGKHGHPLTDAQWEDFVSNLDNIEEAHTSGGILRPRGEAVVAKIKTAQNCFGAVLEFAKNGDVYVKTVLAGTEKQVDALMEKREAGVRLHPGLPGRIAEASDSHAASTSHSLSISSIQEKLGISKRENAGNETLSQGGGRVNKGLITPLSDGRRIVSLLEKSDASTFVHEMGHLFLMDLEDLAQVDEVSKKELALVDAWATWRKGAAKEYKGTEFAGEFAGYEQQIIDAEANGDFDTADRVKRRWRQERFARAFEMYLHEGHAPSKGLRKVFEAFRSFLIHVYNVFTMDGGRASEPVRRVMDRMIATEDEIEEMRLDDRYRDVEAAGGEKLLSEDERDTYERWRKEAEDDAKNQLQNIVMKDLSAKKQQEFDARVERERERYQKELEQNPVVLAKRALDLSGDENIIHEFGFDDMNALGEEAFKEENLAGGLSPMQDGWMEAALKAHMDAYTKELDKELIESYLTEEAAVKAMESSEYHAKLEGLVATALAKKMGLMNKITSKAQRAMMSIEDKLTALPEDVDMKMQKGSEPVKRLMKAINELRFSTRWSPADYASIERMVKAATKADVEAALKEIKTAAKEDKQNEKAVLEANVGRLETYRRVAAESIQKMELADAINVGKYRKQEKEAARRVRQMIQAKKWDVALRAQEQKAMAAELAKASEKLRDEVQKKLKRVQKQLTARTVKLPRDERYWHRHLAFLLRMTKTDAEKPAPRQIKDETGKVVRTEEAKTLQEVFADMEAALDADKETTPTDILEKVASSGENFRGWQSLTKAEFDGAVDALTMLYSVGRDKFKMKTIGGKDIAEVLDEIMTDEGDVAYMNVTQHKVNPDEGGLGYNDWLGKTELGAEVARQGQKYLAVTMKPEEILRALGKTAHKYIYGIYEKAITREAERLEKAVTDLRKIRSAYTHKEVREWKKKQFAFEEIEGKRKLSKENVLSMALNLGTKNNVQRLVTGLGVDEQRLRSFIYEHMTEKDWTFVQNVWDYMDSYWPETVQVEEQLNGVSPKKEPAVPFDVKTADGKIIHMKGGYYRLKYNPDKSIKAANQEENKQLSSAMQGAQVLGTGRDFVKGRAKYVDRTLLFELRVIPDHIQEVIHNIEVRVPARDVYRLIYSKAMEDKVTSKMGMEYYRVLTEWATNVWNVTDSDTNRASGQLNHWLGVLRRNSVMAIMGYRLWPVIENASNLGPVMDKLGATRALSAIADFYAHFDSSKDILYKSVFMRNRINSMDRDIRAQEGLFTADARPFEIIKNHAYDMMLYSDLALSAPLWVATFKDTFGGLVGKVRRERDAAVQAVMEAQAKVDSVKGQITDLKVAQAEAQERERAAAARAAALADAAYDHQFVPAGSEQALFQGGMQEEAQTQGSPFDVKRAEESVGAAGAPEATAVEARDGATRSASLRSAPLPEGEALEMTKERGVSPEVETSANAKEISANAEEAPKSMKELEQELRAAEDAFAKAQEFDILSDAEVVKEAERRAIAEADAAIRDTFGSGRTMDLASIQRQKSEALKLMTTFYSFFNTQFNALFAAYRHGKYSGRTEGMIRRWAPFARSVIYRIVVMSLIGSLLKFALGIDGSDDKDKYRKVKNPETGKEERQEIPALERFLKMFGKNTLSQVTGSFVLVRDIANQALNYAFDGTTYGRSINPMSTAVDAIEEFGTTFSLIARKGEKDLEIEEKHAKEEQEREAKLKKLKGKKRQEYLAKLEEDAKYKQPDKRITYSEIGRHVLNMTSTVTAARTGISNTLVDAITGTMQYLNDTDDRYDANWKNIIWSALFDKKPVEREIPKRPPAPPKKNKQKKAQ